MTMDESDGARVAVSVVNCESAPLTAALETEVINLNIATSTTAAAPQRQQDSEAGPPHICQPRLTSMLLSRLAPTAVLVIIALIILVYELMYGGANTGTAAALAPIKDELRRTILQRVLNISHGVE
jgi:hypothetical protein